MELLTVYMLNTHRRHILRTLFHLLFLSKSTYSQLYYQQSKLKLSQSISVSDLREAEVEDVGVEFAQSSGEAISAQILSTELTAEQTGSQT